MWRSKCSKEDAAGAVVAGPSASLNSSVTSGADDASRNPLRPFRTAPTVAAAKTSAFSPPSPFALPHPSPLLPRPSQQSCSKAPPFSPPSLSPPTSWSLPPSSSLLSLPSAPPRAAFKPTSHEPLGQVRVLREGLRRLLPPHRSRSPHWRAIVSTRLLRRCVTQPRPRRGPFSPAQGRTAPWHALAAKGLALTRHSPSNTHTRTRASLPLKQPTGRTSPGR